MNFNPIACYTLLRKEVLRIFRIWSQTLLPSPVTMTLYLVIFGQIVGRAIGSMQGVTYLEYITPGLVVMSVITNAYANVVSSFFIAKFQRYIEELYVAPMGSLDILLGFTLAGVVRGVVVGILVMIVALMFGDVHIQHPGLTLLSIFAISMLFSMAGLLNGLFAKTFDDINIVPTFILTPLTYLGGIFYPLSLMSPLWAKIALFNPIFYMVDSVRYGFLGQSEIAFHTSLLSILGLNLILWCWGYFLIDRGYGVRT